MRELLAHEHGDDLGRRLVRAEPVLVAGRRNAGAKQRRVFMHRIQDRGEEREEANILVRREPRLEQVVTIELRAVGDDRHRPVAVLARTINSCKRLFMKQGLQIVPERSST